MIFGFEISDFYSSRSIADFKIFDFGFSDSDFGFGFWILAFGLRFLESGLLIFIELATIRSLLLKSYLCHFSLTSDTLIQISELLPEVGQWWNTVYLVSTTQTSHKVEKILRMF